MKRDLNAGDYAVVKKASYHNFNVGVVFIDRVCNGDDGEITGYLCEGESDGVYVIQKILPSDLTKVDETIRGGSLLGMRFAFVYDEGLTVQSLYRHGGDTYLSWCSGQSVEDYTTGLEKVLYMQLSEKDHVLNWLRVDGYHITVSIDTHSKKATSVFGKHGKVLRTTQSTFEEIN